MGDTSPVRASDILATADGVRGIEGAERDVKNRRHNKQLAVEKNPAALDELARLLCTWISGPIQDAAWMEWPTISLVFSGDARESPSSVC